MPVFSPALFLICPPHGHHPGTRAGGVWRLSYFIVFFIVGMLILVHELGHYAAARLMGIPIARVSIGIGGPLVSVRIGRTEYRVSRFPFGGYVMPEPSSYFGQPPLSRLVFAFGGPLANILLTLALLATFNAWLHGASATSILTMPLRQTAVAVAMIGHALPQLVVGSEPALGPLGVLAEGGEFVGSSLHLAVQFAAVMSVNLAILNLAPIPPLDGGRILLCAAEVIWARASLLHVPLNVAGFVTLVVFLWWVTASDVRRIIGHLFT